MDAPNSKPDKVEQIDHPHWYGGDTPYEVIKVLEAWLTPEEYIGFLKGNIIKYHARARAKGGVVDCAKGDWYSKRLVDYLQGVGLDDNNKS